MQQTPAHEAHNRDLLNLVPKDSSKLIEIGCSTGALAREYKKDNTACFYTGLEVDREYAKLAERYCDEVIHRDIETCTEDFFLSRLDTDCWIFGDTLEHLKDPWLILSRIRKVIPDTGTVVACIPNAQHWSIQAKLNSGDFVYAESGLLDRTHLRWFTRKTIIEMFAAAGFEISHGISRIFEEPGRDRALEAIRSMASTMGTNPDLAASDATPLQYVVRAVPVT